MGMSFGPPVAGIRQAVGGLVLGAAALMLLVGCADDDVSDVPDEPASDELDGPVAKASYGIGYNVISNILDQFGDEVDEAAFIEGVRDGMAGRELRIDEAEFMAGIQALSEASAASRTARADDNRMAGEAFMAENAERDGVQTTESGLQYEVMTEGDGPQPAASDEVIVHYEGRLLSGTVFDSSLERGEPVSFPLEGLIPGWVEALQLMPVGSSWRIWVPPQLAYGEQGAGNTIGPNETLVFDVELIGIADDGAEGEDAADE